MKISKMSINRPVAIVTIVFIAIVFGIVGFASLPVDLYPSMNMPYVSIVTVYPGSGPEEVENLITEPIEKTLSSVNDLDELTSYSSAGVSQIVLKFQDSTDVETAVNNVREKVDGVLSSLPDDIQKPIIRKADPNASPIIKIAVSGNEDLNQLKKFIDDKMVNQLQRAEGVASVDVNGYKEKEIQIILKRDKLEGYNLSINKVMQVLKAQNMSMPIGDIQEGISNLSLKIEGEFKSIEEIRNLPIPIKSGTIKLRDIAVIQEVDKDMEAYTFVNGQPSITLDIKKQSTANTVAVADEINKVVNKIKSENPDINIVINKDDSINIRNSISSVQNTGLIGGILAIVVLFIFLKNFRSTLIIGTAIPISIIIAFALMYFFKVGLNMVSLMGLALGIGMLVDNGIVVLENIFRYRKEGLGRKEAAYKGVSEVGFSIIASTLTSIAVFLPIVFTEGFAADIFRDMSLTVTFSLIASLVIALTLIPMMCSKFLKIENNSRENFASKISNKWENVLISIEKKYKKLLLKALNHRKITSFIVALIFVATVFLVPMLGMEFMPKIDEGTFKIDVKMPQGTVVEETLKTVDKVEKKLNGIDEIKEIYVKVQNNTANIQGDVGTVNERKRSIDEIVEQIRNEIKVIPGTEFSVAASSMGNGGSSGKPIAIKIVGDDYNKLHKISKEFVDVIENVNGTREVTSSLSDGGNEGVIEINRNKSSLYGMTISGIVGELRSAVNGSIASKYKVNGDEIDIKIMYDKNKINNLQDVKNLPISTALGIKVPLDEIGDIKKEKAPSQINRENQKRIVIVDAALSGIDTNTAKKQISKKLDEYNMPEGYYYEFGGDSKDMMESFSSLGKALVIGIILTYLIMAAQFESFLYPFVIMFSVPYALAGGVFALVISKTTLSIVGIIGMIMLVGIVVNNAIVLIDYTNQLREKGYSRREALLIAGPTRLRPILMTTMTTVLGMLPMAIGMGQGAEMQAPLARVIIGGLSLATLVTLIIIPVNYTIFEDIARKINKTNNNMEKNINKVAS
ncbi:efflux RND transporter permease subunit [Clostridium ganghwense]|uniref:Efflux RND transporter permease subunit n=1 Tax=Clostridium ganghwense TaxID=312089 RepID=A0ABT4CJ27_9CLOT|nr:efflux RND transporter permease subunit [Clostridium ganghwense]MCY6369052.1 efflux RND transporter permease subunit [Clostridium ganghwense]